jgi:hypothetical protein
MIRQRWGKMNSSFIFLIPFVSLYPSLLSPLLLSHPSHFPSCCHSSSLYFLFLLLGKQSCHSALSFLHPFIIFLPSDIFIFYLFYVSFCHSCPRSRGYKHCTIMAAQYNKTDMDKNNKINFVKNMSENMQLKWTRLNSHCLYQKRELLIKERKEKIGGSTY